MIHDCAQLTAPRLNPTAAASLGVHHVQQMRGQPDGRRTTSGHSHVGLRVAISLVAKAQLRTFGLNASKLAHSICWPAIDPWLWQSKQSNRALDFLALQPGKVRRQRIQVASIGHFQQIKVIAAISVAND